MFFFFNDTATTEIYTLSLHDALPIYLEVVHARALHPTELEHVLETLGREHGGHRALLLENGVGRDRRAVNEPLEDRKSTRLNSSHDQISYAVFCLKKKKKIDGTNSNSIFANPPERMHMAIARLDPPPPCSFAAASPRLPASAFDNCI